MARKEDSRYGGPTLKKKLLEILQSEFLVIDKQTINFITRFFKDANYPNQRLVTSVKV